MTTVWFAGGFLAAEFAAELLSACLSPPPLLSSSACCPKSRCFQPAYYCMILAV